MTGGEVVKVIFEVWNEDDRKLKTGLVSGTV
jgi:hypothetical protein